MKIEIDGNNIRIKGDKFGKERHLLVHCSEMGGEDYYSITVVKDGFQIGCGASYYMNSNHVIEQTSMNGKRFIS